MRRVLASLLLGLCAAGVQAQSGLEQRQEQARTQQAQLRERITQIEAEISRGQADRVDAAQQLKASEVAISDINRKLDQLHERQKTAQQQLKRAHNQQIEQEALLEVRREELAEQLRGQYASGLSPWAALLSGDDPQDISRELQYLGYVNRSQARAVRAVDQSLKRLAELRKTIEDNQAALKELERQVTEQKAELQAQKLEREKVLARIDAELKDQRKQAQQLERNDKRLASLIDKLDVALAEQRERAREEAERRKAEQARLAKERAERERQQREQALQAEQAKTQRERQEDEQVAAARAERARQQRELADQERRSQVAAAPAARTEPVGGFNGLNKGLPLPVRSTEVLGRFGAQRPDGGLWRGIVLRAPEGAPVKAVAGGRVVYASWLSGFGNILIVDHGQKYLSVYAYNQALLRQVGDIVATGDTVASVGATGGQVESGLYFEIRHQGAPVNPLLWLKQP